MKRLLIPALTLTAMLFATNAEAGPIRNLVAKLRGKPKAAAAKVINAVKSPLKCAGGRCSAN